MTYSSGGKIEAADYNTFLNGTNQINAIWSTGSGNVGYGQPAITTVSTGSVITAAKWNEIIGDTGALKKMAAHQGTTLAGTYTDRSSSNTITALPNLSSDISTLYTNRNNYANPGNYAYNSTTTTGIKWYSYTNHIITATFPSYDQARYFFNAGGQLKIYSQIGARNTTDTSLYNSWTNLVTAIGTLVFKGNSFEKVGGSGTPSTYITNVGFHQIGAYTNPFADLLLFNQYAADAPYTANRIFLSCYANSSTPTILTFTYQYVDDYGGGNFGPPDGIDANFTSYHNILYPYTSVSTLANTWSGATLTGVVQSSV